MLLLQKKYIYYGRVVIPSEGSLWLFCSAFYVLRDAEWYGYRCQYRRCF